MDTTNSTTGRSRDRTRSSGLAVLVAGIAFVIGAVGSAVLDALWIAILIGFLGAAYGVPGVHRYQAPADGALGKWGSTLVRYGAAVMVLLGLAFLVWQAVGDPPEEGPTLLDAVWMLGFTAFVIGVILFAIGVVRAKVLPVASGVLMLGGLVAAIAVDMATGAFFETEPVTTQWGVYIGIPVFGLGLAWAGYSVWKDAGARSGTGPAAVEGAPQPA